MEQNPFDITLIISTQRSGTNAIRSMISQCPGIVSAGEVLSGNIPSGLLYYLASEIPRIENFSFRKAELERVFDDYFCRIKTRNPSAKCILIDCKYNSFGVFNPSGWTPLKKPFFIRLCEDRRAKILHIVRNNVFETYLSALRVRATKEWHHPKSKATDQRMELDAVHVDVSKLQWELTKRLSEIGYFRSLFVNYDNCIEVSYESLFSGKDPAQGFGIIEKFLNVDLSNVKPQFDKIINDWRAFVKNYDEVCDAIRSSPHLKEKLSRYFQ